MRKIRLLLLKSQELPAIEDYFEDMAAKGWMLEKMLGDVCFFQKMEPRKLRFSIGLLEKVTVLDADENESSLNYREYCEQAGWKFVCADRGIQVYCCSESEDRIPLETDSQLLFPALRKLERSLFISSAVMFAFLLWVQWYTFSWVALLADNVVIGNQILLLVLTFYEGKDVVCYLLWYRKAKKALTQGGSIFLHEEKDFRELRHRRAWGFIVLLFCLALWLSVIFSNRVLAVRNLLYIILMVGFAVAERIYIKKHGISQEDHMMLSIGAVILIFVVIIGAAALVDNEKEEILQEPVYDWADFGIENLQKGAYLEQKSSFVGSVEWHFDDLNLDGMSDDAPSYQYHFYRCRFPWLLKKVNQELDEKWQIDRENLTEIIKRDDTIVYLEKGKSGAKHKNFILESENTLCHFSGRFEELTTEEIAQILLAKAMSASQN